MRFLLASNLLEARAGGARRVRITGERCAESVSNRFVLVCSLLWKAKMVRRDRRSSLDFLEQSVLFGEVLSPPGLF